MVLEQRAERRLDVLEVERSGDTSVIRLSGEIDMLTTPALRAKVTEELAAGLTTLVLDMLAVEFLGSSGLALLVGPYSRFQWHHPGPLYFYLLAPFYEASGERPSGLSAGALALNLSCLLLIVGWLWQASGARLAALSAAAWGVQVPPTTRASGRPISPGTRDSSGSTSSCWRPSATGGRYRGRRSSWCCSCRPSRSSPRP